MSLPILPIFTLPDSLNFNTPWIAAFAPSKENDPAIDSLIQQLMYMHVGMRERTLYIGKNILAADELSVVIEGLRNFTPRKISLEKVPDGVDVQKFADNVHEGTQLAIAMLADAPELLYQWRTIISHHSQVTESWMGDLAWFTKRYGYGESLAPNSVTLLLEIDLRDVGGEIYPHKPEEHEPYLMYYGFLQGFINVVESTTEYFTQHVPMQNRVLKHLGINAPKKKLSKAQETGIASLYSLARKYAYLCGAVRAHQSHAKQLLGGEAPQVYHSEMRAMFSLITRHDLFGNDLRSGYRGNAVHDAVTNYESIMVGYSSVPDAAAFTSEFEFSRTFQLGNTELAYAAVTVAEVLLSNHPLNLDYWDVVTQHYYDEAKEQVLAKVTKAKEVAMEVGWIEKLFDVNGNIVFEAKPAPFWYQRDRDDRHPGMLSAQLVDLLITCQLLTPAEEELLKVIQYL